MVHRRRGDLDAAIEQATAALALFRETRGRRYELAVLDQLAEMHAELGNDAEAERYASEASLVRAAVAADG